MKWRYALILAGALAILLLALDFNVYVYRWPSNGGVRFDSAIGCIGLEVYGNPGLFGGLDRGACDL